MPSIANPLEDAQAYDVVRIDNQDVPGIVAPAGITGFKRSIEWDVKKGKGTKGGSMTLSQLPPANGSIKFLLWKAEHFASWDTTFRALFRYDPTKKTKGAIDIYHPALAKLDIYTVVTENIGAETPEGLGLWSITVEISEYLPPPDASVTASPVKVKDSIADAKQAEIAKLLAEAQKPRP
jgi:hypothetical protein